MKNHAKMLISILLLIAGALILPHIIGNVLTFAVLVVSVILHEFGHWLPLRASGVGVRDFAIGFGKVLYEIPWKIWGTSFQLRALPLGGLVEPNQEELAGCAAWKRALVFVGGPAMNLFVAWTCLFIITAGWGIPEPRTTSVIVSGLDDHITIAREAGFQLADRILQIGSKPITSASDVTQIVGSHCADTVEFLVQRKDRNAVIRVKPNQDCKIGIVMQAEVSENFRRATVPQAALEAAKRTGNLTNQTAALLGKIAHVIPRSASDRLGIDNMMSPIGIVDAGGKMFMHGFASFLYFCAALNVGLFIMNMLPLPGLDGGHLGFLLIAKVGQALRLWGPVTVIWQNRLTYATFGSLLLLALFLAHNDVIRLMGKEWGIPLLSAFDGAALVCLFEFWSKRRNGSRTQTTEK